MASGDAEVRRNPRLNEESESRRTRLFIEDEHDDDCQSKAGGRETRSAPLDHSAAGPATATRFSVFAAPAVNSTRFPNFSISLK